MSRTRPSRAPLNTVLGRLVAPVLGRTAPQPPPLGVSDRGAHGASALDELFARRFPSLPRDCGQDVEPGVGETEDWQHWVSRETTPDQKRIERYLRSLPLRGKRILHVGVGNSSLAKAFAGRCEFIAGLTISDPELAHAASLNIRNYACVKASKYAARSVTGRYDLILDNNPTGFACCWRHFGAMVRAYGKALNRGGLILTDKVGLAWTSGRQPPGSRWSFSFDDWRAVAETQGLECVAIDDFLIAWAHPGVKVPRAGHYMLQTLRAPWDLARTAKRAIGAKLRSRRG